MEPPSPPLLLTRLPPTPRTPLWPSDELMPSPTDSAVVWRPRTSCSPALFVRPMPTQLTSLAKLSWLQDLPCPSTSVRRGRQVANGGEPTDPSLDPVLAKLLAGGVSSPDGAAPFQPILTRHSNN